MSQTLQGITFGFFEDLSDKDRSHLADILYGDKAQAARPDLPWDDEENPETELTSPSEELQGQSQAAPSQPTEGGNPSEQTAQVISSSSSEQPADSTTEGGNEYQPHPPPGVHAPIYLPHGMPGAVLPGVQPMYGVYPVGVYPPQQGMPPISYVPVMAPPGNPNMPPQLHAEPAVTSSTEEVTSHVDAGHHHPDNNNTYTQSDSNDKQINKILGGKTYERRNKKKRPPNYYQKLEEGSNSNSNSTSMDEPSPETQGLPAPSGPPGSVYNLVGAPGHGQPIIAPLGQPHIQQYHGSMSVPPPGVHMHPPYIAPPPPQHQSSPSHGPASPPAPPLANHIVPTAVPPPHFPPGMGAVPMSSPPFIPPGAPVQGPPPPQRLSTSQAYHMSSAGSVPSNPVSSSKNNEPVGVGVVTTTESAEVKDTSLSGEIYSDRSRTDAEDVSNISFGEVEDEIRNMAEEKNFFPGDQRNNNIVMMKKSPNRTLNKNDSTHTIVHSDGVSNVIVSDTHNVDRDGAKPLISQPARDNVDSNIHSEATNANKETNKDSTLLPSNRVTPDPMPIVNSVSESSKSDEVSDKPNTKQQTPNEVSALPQPTLGPANPPSGVLTTGAPQTGVTAAAPVKPKATSWAGLFRGTSTAETATVIYNEGTAAPLADTVPNKENDALPETVPVDSDEGAKLLGRQLKDYTLCYSPPSIQPRGLINRGNWCYVNATLQALLACSPLYNLLKSLPGTYRASRGPSSTPIIDSIVEFANEFSPMPAMKPIEKNSKDICAPMN